MGFQPIRLRLRFRTNPINSKISNYDSNQNQGMEGLEEGFL